MAYKHRDIVIAWMDGETIQIKDSRDQWNDIRSIKDHCMTWQFGEYECYRIKPKTVMIRHATFKDNNIVATYLKNYSAEEDRCLQTIEGDGNVIWLDDWHEAGFSAPGI